MKKLALISDIHGNYKALEAFLAWLEEHPVEGVISLGDYVTDGPYPQRTMKLLYEMREKYGCYMLRGNREEYLLGNRDNRQGWKPSSVKRDIVLYAAEYDGAGFRLFRFASDGKGAFIRRAALPLSLSRDAGKRQG